MSYTEEELKKFEEENELVLPSDFREYLKKCKKRLDFSLNSIELRINGYCTLEDKDFIKYEELDEDYDFDNGMMHISSEGCGDHLYIVVKGNHYGTLWVEGEFGLYRRHSTFSECFDIFYNSPSAKVFIDRYSKKI